MCNEQEIVRPTKCPECSSSKIRAEVDNGATACFNLIDGKWVYDDFTKGYTDWNFVSYWCDDCDMNWGPEQGWVLNKADGHDAGN